MPLPRVISRLGIECPGDTIPYRCSVQSNSENVQLEWIVTFPGQDAIMISYANDSERNTVEYFPMNISAIQYRTDERVDSEIVLTVQRNVTMIMLECRSEGLASQTETVYVNTSGMLISGVRTKMRLRRPT